MGKSTTAQMFADRGCSIWNADAAVHRLYGKDGAAVAPIALLFPEVVQDGVVDRPALRDVIGQDPAALPRVEAIVHPLVQQDRAKFKSIENADVLVFDIPLLFEAGAENEMDAVACVVVNAAEQRRRVLDRGTMSDLQFEQILAKQMPIADKLARADFRIETDTLDHAAMQVDQILEEIHKRMRDA